MSPTSFHVNTGNCFFFYKKNQINPWSINPTMTQQKEANFQPQHTVTPPAEELRLFLLHQSWQQCTSVFVFAFSPSSQRDFDGTTAHRCSFTNSLAASKKWCLLVGSHCFSVQSPFGSALQQQQQTSSRDIYPQQPSSSFRWLDVLLPSQEKDHFKDTKLEEERVCYCVFHSKPHISNLLVITLFLIITTWAQGRNLKRTKHWNIEVNLSWQEPDKQ